MIVLLDPHASSAQVAAVEAELARLGAGARRVQGGTRIALEAQAMGIPLARDARERLLALPAVDDVLDAKSPHPRASSAPRLVVVGDRTLGKPEVVLGGAEVVLCAGPCAVDETIADGARMVRAASAKLLRGGTWKPRTSPYSFQGGGKRALLDLRGAADAVGLPIVVEVVDEESLEAAEPHVDLLQIGARNGQNYAFLSTVGAARRPVLLKRAPGATVHEWLLAAEHLLLAGCPALVFCERGIRTFEPGSRYTLDLAAVTLARAASPAPIFVDPSHPAGTRALVLPLALAGVAAGADGLLVEAHPDPGRARSDAAQALTGDDLARLSLCVASVAGAVGRRYACELVNHESITHSHERPDRPVTPEDRRRDRGADGILGIQAGHGSDVDRPVPHAPALVGPGAG
ncbi:MAG: 3-deoxy-7-phosphoheptulonate synthase [Deltaproteobacteria bacterium]|nr:3-deoxy-7-phosphoheptulonate synthase [Deltaproteobacteria bacterium]